MMLIENKIVVNIMMSPILKSNKTSNFIVLSKWISVEIQVYNKG